jgi:zeaxanthin glucosyltransferase
VVFDYLGDKLATTGVEALVIDTIHFFVELVPLGMSIPYVHIWNVLHLDFSGVTPASVFSCPLDTSAEGLKRNAENLHKLGATLGPLAEIARSYAEEVGLKIDWNDPAATVSKLAVIRNSIFRESPGLHNFIMLVRFMTMKAGSRCLFHGNN